MSRWCVKQPWPIMGLAAGMCLVFQAHAQDTPVVDTYKLEGFLPPADPGLQFVDAGSGMPADFIRDTLPDFMGRQWASVVRTYWSYPIPGRGALPPAGSGLDALPDKFLNHVQGAVLAHPAGALQDGAQAVTNLLSSAFTIMMAIPPLGTYFGALGTELMGTAGTIVPNAAYGAGILANLITDWVPGTPPVYQVSIDYFKVGVSQPEFAHDMHALYGPIRQDVSNTAHQVFGLIPIRETVGGFLRGIFGPVRSVVRGVIEQGRDVFKGIIVTISGRECRLSYAQTVSTAWPPATEAGFDCGGVTNLRMYVDVGANFAGSQPGYMPIWYDPFSGQWVSYVGLSPLSAVSLAANADYLTLQPGESLVVTIDSVKSRDDLHRLAMSIDYHGLCLAVHPDGAGCPVPSAP